MHIKTLITLFILLVMPFTFANYDPLENSAFLKKLRITKEPEKRINLILSLEKKVSESTRKTLEIIALDTKESGDVRMQAICSLGGMANQKTLPVLLNILEDEIQQHRGFWACAIPALAELKNRRAIPLFIRTANQREEHLAGMDHMAIKALAEIGDEREVALLASKMSIAPVRFAVVKGLARIASLKSTEALIEALQGAEDQEVVIAAQWGILKIGKAAIPVLKNTLENAPENWDKKYWSRIQTLIQKIEQ